jgi:hypothetical protein
MKTATLVERVRRFMVEDIIEWASAEITHQQTTLYATLEVEHAACRQATFVVLERLREDAVAPVQRERRATKIEASADAKATTTTTAHEAAKLRYTMTYFRTNEEECRP